MKIKFVLSSVAIAAVCGTLQALAQPTTATTASDDHSLNRDGRPYGQYRLGKLEKANKIIGKEIRDSQDQKLGKVEDLAVDLHNGHIVEVIVSTGGVLGVDEQLRAVPPGQFTCDAAQKSLVLNVDQARFKEAPSFKMSEWDSTVRQPNVVEVYKYYGAQPYFTSTEQAIPNGQVRTDTTTPPTHPAEVQQNTARPNTAQPDIAQANARECSLGEVQRASKLMGSSVRNMQDEKIGKVDNMMVDLPAGRVVEVIVASGGFLGLGDELSAVPPQSFHAGTQPDALTLDTTKEALANAPHFKSSDWANAENPEQIGMVYHSYNVQPYFDANAPDNTAQNVRDRNDSALTPLSQGTSAADVETTREIRKQIEAADGFSVDARNVKVITVNGRVTLRGPVKTQEEKRRIGDIAAKVVTPANVDNQLQVEQSSASNS